jgi:ACS family pantothenate transporter-like MFS transporter
MDGVITLPIAFIGFLLFPGLPSSKKPWFLSVEEHALSKSRMPSDHRQAGKLDFNVVKRALRTPLYYICIFAYIALIQSSYWTGYMALWLKSLAPRYSIPGKS